MGCGVDWDVGEAGVGTEVSTRGLEGDGVLEEKFVVIWGFS